MAETPALPGSARFISWPQLPPELQFSIANILPRNDVSASLRLVNRETAALFRGEQFATIHLSEPVPHHAFARRWALDPATIDGFSDAMRELTLAERTELLRLTSSSGCTRNLEVAWLGSGLALDARAWRGHPTAVSAAAAAAGHLNICEWLLLNVADAADALAAAMRSAARHGQRAVCEWLIARGCRVAAAAVLAAARGGHVELMEWLLGQVDEPVPLSGLRAVAYGCDLATLRRLHREWHQAAGQPEAPVLEVWDDKRSAGVLGDAVRSPTPDWREKVEWLEGQGYPRTANICKIAATRPDALERLQWLRQRGYPVDYRALYVAAQRPSTAVLQFLLAEGARPQRCVASVAANAGRPASLEVLRAAGCRVSARLPVIAAVLCGDLGTLDALVERHGPAEAARRLEKAHAAYYALGRGKTEVLDWLHAHGCPPPARGMTDAARMGSVRLLRWLAAHRYPRSADGEPYGTAVFNYDKLTVRWLRRLGCSWGPKSGFLSIFEVVAKSGSVAMLDCLLEEGCPIDWAAAEYKAQCCDGEFRKWVRDHRP